MAGINITGSVAVGLGVIAVAGGLIVCYAMVIDNQNGVSDTTTRNRTCASVGF